MILQDKVLTTRRPVKIKANAVELKLNIKSSASSKNRIPIKAAQNQVELQKDDKRLASIDTNPLSYLDKIGSQININHNSNSKSVGRENFKEHNKVKILEPQYESAYNSKIQNKKETFRNTRYTSHEIYFSNAAFRIMKTQDPNDVPNSKRRIQRHITQDQFITLDNRQSLDNSLLKRSTSRAEELTDSRRKLYSSVQGVNLPKIHQNKGQVEQSTLRKSASYVSQSSCNILLKC